MTNQEINALQNDFEKALSIARDLQTANKQLLSNLERANAYIKSLHTMISLLEGKNSMLEEMVAYLKSGLDLDAKISDMERANNDKAQALYQCPKCGRIGTVGKCCTENPIRIK